jgi:cytochrome c oxidase assembly protein subunit 15
MSLDEFKTIFYWEWSHRLIGRMIGVVFLLPFLYFLWRGGLSKSLKIRLWILFVLGGLQGAIGWWMVASGLSGRTEVSQYRLAVHLMLAIVIFSVIVRTTIRMTPRAPMPETSPRLSIMSHAILGLIYLQIYFGALVAGLRAGKAYNTWPQIDGAIIPAADRLFFESPWWRNFFDNVLTVQFSHRMIAYTLLAAVIWHAIDVLRSGTDKRVIRGALWLVVATFAQAVIGIMTLVYNVPIDIALAHQGGAVVVLTLALFQSERLSSARVPQPVAAHAFSA